MTRLSVMKQLGEKFKNQKCVVPGCTNNRPGVSTLCNSHHAKKMRYGHVLGKTIKQHQYQDELKEVKAFVEDHQEHPAITAGVVFFQRWIDQAGKQEAEVGQPIFVRLHGHCIPAKDVLVEVAALWLYATRNHYELPDDQRLTFALARSVMLLSGMERKRYGVGHVASKYPRYAELKATGERIRQTLARFFVNLVVALNAKADQEKAIGQNLTTPFV